jgi:2-oxoglutarate ferredoxin oxidoreductase subunit gamma
MSLRREIRVSGSGGQGIILISKILAEAAAVFEDLNATQTQSYGPEARGGSSRADVIISDDDIDYPRAERLDLLLALTQEACDQYVPNLKEGGTLVVDSDLVPAPPEGPFRVFALPIIDTAQNKLKKGLVANIVALGTIIGLSDFLDPKNVEAAVLSRVPRGTEELNLTAFRSGLSMAEAATEVSG